MRDMQTGCSNKPVVFVDLFCGMGGFGHGAERAGATCILAVDNWLPALKVHRANNGHTPMMLTLGSPNWYVWLNKFLEPYREKYHIHIHGSPPCQAISNASSRDPKEGMTLVYWYLDLVKRVEPDSWSMENVIPVRKLLPEGTPSMNLNAADFGVPQTRMRTYAGEGWVPVKTHKEENWVSVVDALPGLLHEIEGNLMARADADEWTAVLNTGGAGPSNSRRARSGDKAVTQPMLTMCNNNPSLRLVKLEATGSNSNRRQDRTILEPSKTICGSGNQVGPRIFDHNDNPIKIRSLKMEETLVIQGFPNTYDLSEASTQKERWTMIGNAVPPLVAKGVIRGIIR